MSQFLWTALGFFLGFATEYVWCMIRRKPDRTEHQSPPRGIAIMLVVVAFLSIISTVVEESRRSDQQRKDSRRACEITAQIVLRQNESIAANGTLGRTLHDLIGSKSREQSVVTLKKLEEYYNGRSQAAKTLPPLPIAAVRDCEDGTYDGQS